jgi:putative ABC transport system permease protein
MLIYDLFEETLHAITSNKVRTSLTVLGIVIGISSVIAMVAIGQGAQNDIQTRIASMGSNLLVVAPGSQRSFGSTVRQGQGSASTLTKQDAEAIAEIPMIKAIAPEVSTRKQVSTKGSNTNTSILGTTEGYMTARNIEIQLGSFLTDRNIKALSKVAVIGATVRTDLFDENTDPIGQKIRVGNMNFTVIGVTTETGNNSDDQILVPITTAQQFLVGSDTLSRINVSVEDESYMESIYEQINNLLMQRHKIDDPVAADFSITSMADIQEMVAATTQTFTILLGSIAAISLLVGGIGIMNMMLTTVTERTREIGLRKALGAKKTDIAFQFLTESALITLIGGMIGIVLGWLIAYGIRSFTGLSTVVSVSSVLLAFFVAAGIGILFGYYPARRASNLDPIEALRYE